MSQSPTNEPLPAFEQRLLQEVLETYPPALDHSVATQPDASRPHRRRQWTRAGMAVGVLGLFVAAGAVATMTRTSSEPSRSAVSRSGRGDAPLRTAPVGTPNLGTTISSVTTAPVVTDEHARRLLETLGDEDFNRVRLLRSSEQGDVYVASGGGRICLAARQPDNGGAVGCTPSDVAQDPSTPLVVITNAGREHRIVALVRDDVTAGTISATGTELRVTAENNVLDGVIDSAPETLTLKRRDGTTRTVELHDQDRNEQP